MNNNNNNNFSDIDRESRQFKEAIEYAFAKYLPYIGTEQEQTDFLHFYNVTAKNYQNILLLRNGIFGEEFNSYTISGMFVSDSENKRYKDIQKQREKVSNAFFACFGDPKHLRETAKRFRFSEASSNEFPFFVYLDNALRPHINEMDYSEKSKEKSVGIVSGFKKSEKSLLKDFIKFISDNHPDYDLKKLPDEVFKEFCPGDSNINSKKQEKLKKLWIESNNLGIYSYNSIEQGINTGDEDTDKKNEHSFNTPDGESFQTEKKYSENDLRFLSKKSSGDNFDKQMKLLKSVFLSLPENHKKIVSIIITVNFIKQQLHALMSKKHYTYKQIIRHKPLEVENIIRLSRAMAQKYPYFSESVIDNFEENKELITQKEISKAFNISESMVTVIFNNFKKKISQIES